MPVFLKKIELFGFKSFPDRCKLEFKSPITAIVGPNGSGKSNLIDAVRWVLGENSIKTLRGDNFEDILFSGSQYRQSMSVAEVMLSFDNSSRILNIPSDEVEILKRYYRSGEGKIFINRQEVRVKDVVSLFLGTGFGKEGYSIVGQGEVDKLVVGTPQDKRNYIDELLGLSKVKFKKKEAERRLNDIRSHIETLTVRLETSEREYSRLKNEVEKLGLYRQLSRELEHLDKILLSTKVRDYDEELRRLNYEKSLIEKEIQEKIKIKEEIVKSLDLIDRTIIQENLTLSNDRDILNQLEKDLKNKEMDKKSLEGSLETSKRTITILSSLVEKELLRKEELIREKDRLDNSILEITNRIREIDKEIERFSSSITEVEVNKRELEKKKYEINSKLTILKEVLKDVESLENQLMWAISRLDEIKTSIEEAFNYISKLNQEVDSNKQNIDLLTSEIVSLKEEQNQISMDILNTSNTIKDIENNILKLQSVIKELTVESEKMFQEFSKSISSSALKIGEFISKVETTSEKICTICDSILNSPLDTQVVKDHIVSIKNMSQNLNNDIKTLPYLSSATEFISKKIEIDSKILELRNNIDNLMLELDVWKDKLSKLRETQREINFLISSKESEFVNFEKVINELSNQIKFQSKRLDKLESEKIDLETTIRNIEDKVNNLIQVMNSFGVGLDFQTSNLRRIDEYSSLFQRLKETIKLLLESIDLSNIEDEIRKVDILLSDQKRYRMDLEAQRTILLSDIKSSRNRIDEILKEIAKIDDFVHNKKAEMEREEENICNANINLTSLKSILDEISTKRDELLKVVSERTHRLKELNQEYKNLLSEKDKISSELSSLEKGLFQLDEKIAVLKNSIENINSQCLERYGLSVNEIPKEVQNSVDGMDIDKLSKRVSHLRSEIRRIGFVDENAEGEFNKVKDEYEMLKSSFDDVLQSKEKLESIISEINLEIERIVSESLDRISEVITEIFKEVFGGGSVKVDIHNDDLVEGGIEINVSLPGKKVRNLMLLSGGEKALVGIIFIFSALILNNTPIVIMDEVDAPLDDENTERFKKLVLSFKDKTQFIIVSHNKSTIEICQDIYGVTMEERGVSKIVSYRLQDVIL
ncbi:MAG: AAA family ATPase [Spirochaetes bacterium]|nr:AAA family ATPase [Spirochaetota bacterium]